jgi:hypothetical protein
MYCILPGVANSILFPSRMTWVNSSKLYAGLAGRPLAICRRYVAAWLPFHRAGHTSPLFFVAFFGGLVGWTAFFVPPGAIWGTGRCIACQRLHGSQAVHCLRSRHAAAPPSSRGLGVGLVACHQTACWIWGRQLSRCISWEAVGYCVGRFVRFVYIVLLSACSSSPALMNHVMLLICHSLFAFRGAQVLCH